MSVFFISDLHLGHENMAIHRGFANAEDMNLHIITKWNSIVNKRDLSKPNIVAVKTAIS